MLGLGTAQKASDINKIKIFKKIKKKGRKGEKGKKFGEGLANRSYIMFIIISKHSFFRDRAK